MARTLQEIAFDAGLFDAVVIDAERECSDPSLAWLRKWEARGYVWIRDADGSDFFLHPETERFILGYPCKDGIEVHLWDDFFNKFDRDDFRSDGAYLDAVEARFNKLWEEWTA